MKPAGMRSKNQVYSVGNYLMTGKVLGKGHFARVEEATHRIIGKKVAIKIIDLTCIKEEYARRNLHREPRVMAKLRHPCIAALYETMMHGPRLYVVMEAAGGGDLCAHVLAARGARGARGLPEPRARALAAQLVSAVRHMHARGVVHRDLKMENIMLDTTKQFIKIVDFGLSNVWSSGGALRTPCGSLEYAAPELFVDGRRYGPEVDLWSIGVIVYGMVTGGLPFTGAEGGAGAESRSRPQLRAAIARGFTRKQKAALACVSPECKTFIQHLLEPNVELRMKIEEAARHRWVRRPGMKMKTHPLGTVESKTNRDIYRQISELCGQTVMDTVAQIKADPFGALAGIYNIKTHLHQMQAVPGTELLWSTNTQEPRPLSPPEYHAKYEADPVDSAASSSKMFTPLNSLPIKTQPYTLKKQISPPKEIVPVAPAKPMPLQVPQTSTINSSSINSSSINSVSMRTMPKPEHSTINSNGINSVSLRTMPKPEHSTINSNGINSVSLRTMPKPEHSTINSNGINSFGVRSMPKPEHLRTVKRQPLQSPRFSMRPLSGNYTLKNPVYKVYENGDCCLDPRLPSIDEHSNTDLNEKKAVRKTTRTACVRKVNLEEERPRLGSCPTRNGEVKRNEFYRRGGDGLPSWRASGALNAPPARILLQSNATTIKRASLGNIVSPHSSSNSHCKSERAMPVGWYSTRNTINKDPPHLQRLRRTTPLK